MIVKLNCKVSNYLFPLPFKKDALLTEHVTTQSEIIFSLSNRVVNHVWRLESIHSSHPNIKCVCVPPFSRLELLFISYVICRCICINDTTEWLTALYNSLRKKTFSNISSHFPAHIVFWFTDIVTLWKIRISRNFFGLSYSQFF